LDPEEQLLIDIKADPQKFSVVFDEYYSRIFGYILRRVIDYDIACDIVSETFLKAFLHIKKCEWKGVPLSFWLYRIATNEIQLYFRKKRYIPASLSSLIDKNDWDLVDPKTTPEDKLQSEKELREHDDFLTIQNKMKTLPLKYQDVLALRFYEEKSIKEIALILNKNENTIKSHISRGLEKLRKLLS
jgi:RNA polymerase sigma-70 factor, ECF subfamily